MHLGNSGRGARRGPWGLPDALRCAGEGERAPRTPPRLPEVRFAVVDTLGVAATRRPRPAMPCGVVDLSQEIKEALSRLPSVQVGPGCTPKQCCGHAHLDARRSPRRLRGASFAAAGVAHLGCRSSLRPECAILWRPLAAAASPRLRQDASPAASPAHHHAPHAAAGSSRPARRSRAWRSVSAIPHTRGCSLAPRRRRQR